MRCLFGIWFCDFSTDCSVLVYRGTEVSCRNMESTLSLYQFSHDVEGHSSLHLALIFQSVAGGLAEHMEQLALVVDLTRDPGLVNGRKR